MLRPPLIMAAALCGVLTAKTAVAVWDYTSGELSGDYVIYGGYPTQAEAHAPTPGDAKVAFSLRGTAAKEIYDAIGAGPARGAPPERACTGHPEIKVRERDALICRHSPRGYWCTFGFDLSTGLSIWGITGGRICEG
ncbi:hypothetical protein GCM10027320_34560 [Massilia solisilvae]